MSAKNKNKELMHLIGRQLRQDPEYTLMQALPSDIALHVERLQRIEREFHNVHDDANGGGSGERDAGEGPAPGYERDD